MKDPKAWAEYLREVANEPPDTSDAAPALVAGPREARDVAREAAGEVAATVAARLDKAEGMLEGFRGKLEAFVTQTEWKFHEVEKQLSGVLSALGSKLDTFASSVRGQLDASTSTTNVKLDHAQASLNDADAQLELVRYALAAMEAKREKDKTEIVRAAWGGGVLAVLGSVVFMHCHVSTAVSPNVSARRQDGVTEGAVSGGQSKPHVDRRPVVGSDLGERKVTPVPRKPLPGQAVTPCQGAEKTLYGSCWIETSSPAPCPPEFYQDGQRCYVPVMDHSKSPVGRTPLAPNPESP